MRVATCSRLICPQIYYFLFVAPLGEHTLIVNADDDSIRAFGIPTTRWANLKTWQLGQFSNAASIIEELNKIDPDNEALLVLISAFETQLTSCSHATCDQTTEPHTSR